MTQGCSVDGCENPHSGKGLCLLHYGRWFRTGSTELVRVRRRCSFPGCEKWRDSHGYCSTHYRRIKVHGDVNVVLKGGPKRDPDRRSVTKGGYIAIYRPGHPLAEGRWGDILEHRVVLYDSIGPGAHPCHHCGRVVVWGLKDKRQRLEVDHLDGNRQNNDPANLVPSCNRCNDGQANRRRTHCIHGHEFTPDNTYIYPTDGSRRCRECMRIRDRIRRPKGTPR